MVDSLLKNFSVEHDSEKCYKWMLTGQINNKRNKKKFKMKRQ